MTALNRGNVPTTKRRKLDAAAPGEAGSPNTTSTGLSRPISPPVTRHKSPTQVSSSLLAPTPTWGFDDVPKQTLTPSQPLPPKVTDHCAASSSETSKPGKTIGINGDKIKHVASPFQLTQIRDMASHLNVNTIGLKDILGNPMIKECWNFNFLFDLDFVMQQFDEDVRGLVKVKIVHGFWRRDDERRIDLMETAKRYPNVELINAYLPDPFGTHHSKMLILFWHNDCAQVIIHTANMISKDWTNMTQAVWQSPRLPLKAASGLAMGLHTIGNGNRFQNDLCRYLLNYEKRLQKLIDQLALYDFSEIRAAFLGSAPSRQVVNRADPLLRTSFGWLGLREILSSVPIKVQKNPKKPPHIVLQVSSIATLGAAPTWLSHFQSVLTRSHSQPAPTQAKIKFNIIFPTPEEVRTSLDGYESGGSIHMKIQSAQQQKQLQYLHPLLCHWKQPSAPAPTFSVEPRKEAQRGPAAPHIKTYIRFSDDTHANIDWALLTSANLSKQAWGDVVNKQGEVRIQSYETGVLVWPELFSDREPGCEVSMVPTFGKDMPGTEDGPVESMPQLGRGSSTDNGDREDEETEDEDPGPVHNDDDETEDEVEDAQLSKASQSKDMDSSRTPLHNTNRKHIVVGMRMPYDLPLSSYSAKDVPWCATQRYTEPDWQGRAWVGFQPR